MNRQQLEHLAEELRASVDGVAKAAELLAAGHSGPFLARYRRDETGGLDRQQVARIQRAAAECDRLDEQRATILRSLDTQSKLTDELRAKIEAASSRQELDDLYRPHGPQRPSFADEAKKQGLAELAEAIRQAEPGGSELQQLAAKHAEAVDKSAEENDAVAEGEAALLGAGKILAEQLVDDPGIRDRARRLFRSHGTLVATRADKAQDKKARPFKDFFNYREALAKAPPHRVLAINRGERAKALTVSIECDAAALEQLVGEAAIAADHPHADFLRRAIADGVNQLLIPSLQSEARRDLTDRAEQHAIDAFAETLRNQLMQRPLAGKRVLAIDPGFSKGCKLAAIDEHGDVLEVGLFHLTDPKPARPKASKDPQPAESTATRSPTDGSPTTGSPTTSPPTTGDAAATPEETAVGGEHQPTDQPPADQATAEAASTEPPTLEPPTLETPTLETPTLETPTPAPAATNAETPDTAGPETAGPETIESAKPGTAEGAPEAEAPAGPQTEDGSTSQDGSPTPAVAESPTPEAAGTDRLIKSGAWASSDAEPLVNRRAEIARFVTEHNLNLIAIGNGKASRPCEELVASVIGKELNGCEVEYLIVNGAGANAYANGSLGREELPDLDPRNRSAVSIGRRAQDPLRELAKVDPTTLAAGVLHGDGKSQSIRESLEQTLEDCVSSVGVDVNTAGASTLRHVAGLNALTARRIVEHRDKNGPFRSRQQLLAVEGFGDDDFLQSAGFLRVEGGDNRLDATAVHPERYDAAGKLFELLGVEPSSLTAAEGVEAFASAAKERDTDELAATLGIGRHAVDQLIDALSRPGHDPRLDAPPPVLRRGLAKIEDLTEGMELQGAVLSVVDFGAFVDIGMADSGLVHVSRMSHGFVRDPHALVSVGDQVRVWVASVDTERRRVSLSMIEPGSRPPKPPRRGPSKPRSAAKPTGSAASKQARGGGGKRADAPSGGAATGNGAPPAKRPRRGAKPPRDKRGKSPRKPVGPRVFEKKADGPPPELTDEMQQGTEAMRTFGDLMQFMQKKDEPEDGATSDE